MMYASNRRGSARSTDLTLRATGFALLGLSWFTIHILTATPEQYGHGSPTILAVGLATIGFIAGSLGGALLTLGGHVFDEIEVSTRWATPAALQLHRTEKPIEYPADPAEPAARNRSHAERALVPDVNLPRTILPAFSQAQR